MDIYEEFIGVVTTLQAANIEFAVCGEPREAFMVAKRQPRVVDTFGVDEAEAEVAEVIVIGRCD